MTQKFIVHYGEGRAKPLKKPKKCQKTDCVGHSCYIKLTEKQKKENYCEDGD